MADDIVVGSVAVDIVPDTTNFRRDLQAKVQGINVEVDVSANTEKLRADLDEITRPREAKITATADTAAAALRLDEVARDRTANIKANVDRSGLADVGKAAGNMSLLASSAVTLGPALIPIAAALAGIGLALGAPLAIAGGGATVFGFLTGFAVSKTNQQLSDIEKTRQKLSTLKQGTKEYTAEQKLLQSQLAALSPAQKRYSDALDHIKGTFADLLGGQVGDKLLNPVSQFLNLTADVLPKLTPVISGVSDALSTLLGDLADATKGPGFRDFVNTLGRDVGPDIVQFGHIFGNVFSGLAGLLIAFNDTLGGPVLRGLSNITGKFADFGQNADKSKKLQDFIGYVKDVGPQVGDTLSAVGGAIGHIVHALAPLGPPALKVIEGIANAISGIPIPVLTGLAAAAAGLVAVSKLTKVGGNIGGLFSGVVGGFGERGGTPAKPLYVIDVGDGLGGGKTPGGIFGKVGTLALGATAIGALDEAMGPLFKKEFGSGLGNAVTDSIRAAFNLPDPQLKGAGAKIAQGFFDALFHRKQGPLQTPQQVQSVIDARRGDIPEIRSTTDKVDALNAHLKTASRTLDLIGPHADNAFGRASRDVQDFSSKLAAIRDKKIQVILNDQAAVRSLERLQALRLNDKTLTIRIEQEIDRAVGPGGGRGTPTGPTPSARTVTPQPSARRSGSGNGAGAGPLVNIEHANVSDTHDIIRKAGDAVRARAGGGVIMRPSPTPSF